MIILRFLLLPVAILYGLLMQIRNWFYDLGLIRSYKSSIPVISVGNITAGGTGKTPFTIFLANYFLKKDIQVAVVSRGYGRKDNKVRYVNSNSDPILCGDEPMLIADSARGSIVAVGPKRAEVIKKISSENKIDLIILDDGFQHRSVNRDLDILLYNISEKWKNYFVIPTGNLREFRKNIKRADYILLNNYNKENDKISIKKPFAFIEQKNDRLSDIHGKILSVDNIQKKCVAFCGIAHPEQFKNSLQNNGFQILDFLSFKDHKYYSKNDLKKITDTAEKIAADVIICTEKDLVKIRKIDGIKSISQKIYALKLEYSLKSADNLYKMLYSLLDRNG